VPGGTGRQSFCVDEELISRSEIVAFLFTISDMARSVERIEWILGGEDDGEEEADES
jgi:hypothetical protein